MADFVTGATGCLGRHVVRYFLSQGRNLICAVRAPDRILRDSLFQSSRITLVPCNFMDPDWTKKVAHFIASCENVVHLAGEMPHRPTCREQKDILWRVNVEATQNLWVLAEQAKRFLFVSSISVYGDSFDTPKDELSPPAPADYYAQTKRTVEEFLLSRRPTPRVSVFIVRPGIIYGDHDTNVIQKMIELIDKRVFRIIGNGHSRRSLSAGPLVAEVLHRLSQDPGPGILLNVADPHSPTLGQLVADIARLLAVAPPSSIPRPLAYVAASVFTLLDRMGFKNRFKTADVKKIISSNPINCRRLEKFLGNIPDYYSAALETDVAWYKKRKAGAAAS